MNKTESTKITEIIVSSHHISSNHTHWIKMFFIFPLFLLCAILFTFYLVAITVRDARRVAEREPTEAEIDIIALRRKFAKENIVSVTGCCGCEGMCECEDDADGEDDEDEVFAPDLVEDPELRRQVE